MKSHLYLFFWLLSTLLYAQSQESTGEEDFDLAANLEENIANNTPSKIISFSRQLSLADALAIGLNQNVFEKSRQFQFEQLDLAWDDDFQEFWFPRISLVSRQENQLVEKVFTDNSSGNGTSRTPRGLVGLEIAQHSLFNWGRDYLAYLNNKEIFQRNKQILKERRRQLRFSIIARYFDLSTQKSILSVRRLIVEKTSFLFKAAREKLGSRQTTYQEVLMAKEEYLNAVSLHRELLAQIQQSHRDLATTLGDDTNTNYVLTNEIKFKTLNLDVNEAQQFADKNNPDLLQAKVNLAVSSRRFQKSLKDNLPLPTVSLRMGTYAQTFGEAGVRDNFYTDESLANRNVELVAAVNFSWTLFGRGGFFNSRTNESFYLDQRISEVELLEVKRQLQVSLPTMIRQIQYRERQIESLEKRLENARLGFDRSLDLYLGGNIRFVELKILLDAYRESFEQLRQNKLNHLILKMDLSEMLGLENLPDQNFEKIVENSGEVR